MLITALVSYLIIFSVQLDLRHIIHINRSVKQNKNYFVKRLKLPGNIKEQKYEARLLHLRVQT